MKSYRELSQLKTLAERFRYLDLTGTVGAMTFGGHREWNQEFYSSDLWREVRRKVLIRDEGCEMGLQPYIIPDAVYVHHINPMTIEDFIEGNPLLLDPDNLVCVSYDVHQAIHYGNSDALKKYEVITRTKNDTCPWK